MGLAHVALLSPNCWVFTETGFSHSKGYLTGWKEEIFILRVFAPDSLRGLGLLDVSPNAQNVTLYHIQCRPNEKDKSFHVLDRGAIAWEIF